MNFTQVWQSAVNNSFLTTILVGIFVVLWIIANQMIEKNKKGKKSRA